MQNGKDITDDREAGKPQERRERKETCTCGWEIARARELCTERDCFYK